jgi:hypothetical protein
MCYWLLQLPESRISKTTKFLLKRLGARVRNPARATQGDGILRIPANFRNRRALLEGESLPVSRLATCAQPSPAG